MICFEHVKKRYEGGECDVFCDFNEHIAPGEFVLLTGESGAGKSTLFRLILKETPLSGGRIIVAGRDIGEIGGRDIPFYRRKIGVVFQETMLVEEKNVYENVELARVAIGGGKSDSKAAIAAWFRILGIGNLHKYYPAQLSGGQRQRVCLARALINGPQLLLADEPTGNLSPAESREIMELFEMIHRQGVTVVVATHDKENAAGLAYREIALQKEGDLHG